MEREAVVERKTGPTTFLPSSLNKCTTKYVASTRLPFLSNKCKCLPSEAPAGMDSGDVHVALS